MDQSIVKLHSVLKEENWHQYIIIEFGKGTFDSVNHKIFKSLCVHSVFLNISSEQECERV